MKSLQDLFLDQLADLYDAEHRLAEALPRMSRLATQEEVAEAFTAHAGDTEGHLMRLEDVFQTFGETSRRKRCAAIVGLLKESEEMAAENWDSPTLDAALIAAAQKIEHYEIASYGCLRAWAEALGQDEAVDLIEDILDEEKAADDRLTGIASRIANPAAQVSGESDAETQEMGPARPVLHERW